MSAADERVQLLALAETEPDAEVALTALLLSHARLDDPSNPAGWICGCLHQGRLGESHARHQAAAVLDVIRRRGWLR